MSYVICEPCVGTKDTECRMRCPVDAIFEEEDHLVIDPSICVDCGICETVCPVSAIFHEDKVPSAWANYKRGFERKVK